MCHLITIIVVQQPKKLCQVLYKFFVKKPDDTKAGRDFEDKLFRLRRQLEKSFSADEFFICSLSSKTIVYKGMLHAFQVGLFYPDLQDEHFKSHIALTHSRFLQILSHLGIVHSHSVFGSQW